MRYFEINGRMLRSYFRNAHVKEIISNDQGFDETSLKRKFL